MGGRSKAEKNAERQEQALDQEQSQLEAQQKQQEQLSKQELMKRRLAAIRGMQGGNSIGGSDSGQPTNLSQTIG